MIVCELVKIQDKNLFFGISKISPKHGDILNAVMTTWLHLSMRYLLLIIQFSHQNSDYQIKIKWETDICNDWFNYNKWIDRLLHPQKKGWIRMTRLGICLKGRYAEDRPTSKRTNTWILIDWTTQKVVVNLWWLRGGERHQRTFSPTFSFRNKKKKKNWGDHAARVHTKSIITREGRKKKKPWTFFPPFLLLFLSSQETLGPCIHSYNVGDQTIYSPVFIHLFNTHRGTYSGTLHWLSGIQNEWLL